MNIPLPLDLVRLHLAEIRCPDMSFLYSCPKSAPQGNHILYVTMGSTLTQGHVRYEPDAKIIMYSANYIDKSSNITFACYCV